MSLKQITIKDQSDLEKFAKNYITLIKDKATTQAIVVAFSGELGAGKTTFVQLVAKELGITETVTSPTFTIMKIYQINGDQKFKQLVHIDAYRIDDLSEVAPLRLGELMSDNNNLVCIEWSEKIMAVLPDDMFSIDIKVIGENEREITYS
ncbi:MAG: tRNA (adenosine(37)-N6)-threonylcarbamoyltransferase complex ATPase subunit type 1 TsaE [Candidatus Nomurabacteria bacterium]|nr:tRNA (adenosine(37)-N6)-threonylcarbamoyltransferase complex ATPase subunit type 1 TsaE [Candidatus Nomurabacteria bacterium]USN87311.1 MAG: tRNA (adenosine(37)-N6)-threonylcarbamoyltransferase complex ATPase subunit type 1 TsaE [Candidatus Nomurabacteria bacterium]